MLTVPLVTAILCAVPGVNVVPLIDWIVGVVPSGSLSPVSGNNATAVSSLVV